MNPTRKGSRGGPLVPCPTCKRHVFAEKEASCPFCAAELPSALAAGAARATTRRMSRAETFTFNARREIPSRELAAAVGGIAVPLASSFPTTWPIMEGLAIDGAYIADDGDSPDPVRRFLPTTAGPSGTLEIGSARTEPYDPGGVQPIYGAPVVDPGGVQPIYGAPVVEPCDPPDFGGIQPIYGAPVVRNDEPAPEVAASIEMA